MNLLPTCLESLSLLCTNEKFTRFSNGVQLKTSGNTFVAESTDCRAAIRVTGECLTQDPENPYPAIPALDSAPNGECSSIIPQKEWKAAFAAAKKIKSHRRILQSVAVVAGK